MDDFHARFTSRERTVIVVLALYTTVAVIVLTPIGGAFGDEHQTALPPPPAGTIADPSPEPTAATIELAAAEQQRARGIVAADKALATALGGTPHAITKSGPWTTSGANGQASRLLGAAFVVTPQKPVELRTVALPGALYDQTERTASPYQRVVNTVSAKHVTQLMVLVDLLRGQVVNITPGPESQGLKSVPPAGFRRTVPMPREGGR